MALITDFDCWHEEETVETVSVGAILEVMHKNTETAKEIVKRAIPKIADDPACDCKDALASLILTDKSIWPADTVEKLKPILEKYL